MTFVTSRSGYIRLVDRFVALSRTTQSILESSRIRLNKKKTRIRNGKRGSGTELVSERTIDEEMRIDNTN